MRSLVAWLGDKGGVGSGGGATRVGRVEEVVDSRAAPVRLVALHVHHALGVLFQEGGKVVDCKELNRRSAAADTISVKGALQRI